MTQPDVYELILRRCEGMFHPWDDNPANNHAWINNDEIMPIIRELLNVIGEQQTEVKRISDYFCACSDDGEIVPQVVAHNTLAATSERLNKLGKAE
jgi:hypothetical protein